MKKLTIKYLAGFLCFVFFICCCAPYVNAQGTSNVDDQVDYFCSLVEQRDKAALAGNQEVADELNEQLLLLGAENLTTQQVLQKVQEQSGDVAPCFELPDSNHVSWTSQRFLVNGNLKSYEVQIVCASPVPNYSSNLKDVKSIDKILYPEYDGVTSTVNVLTVSAGSVVGAIPKYGAVIVTLADFFSAFLSGKPVNITVKDGASITYKVTNHTFVRLAFVKDYGQSDDLQKLSYIATKTHTTVGVLFQNDEYDSNGEIDTVTYTGEYELEYESEYYDADLVLIVRNYNAAAILTSYISSIPLRAGLSGEEEIFYRLAPCAPSSIAHILV